MIDRETLTIWEFNSNEHLFKRWKEFHKSYQVLERYNPAEKFKIEDSLFVLTNHLLLQGMAQDLKTYTLQWEAESKGGQSGKGK